MSVGHELKSGESLAVFDQNQWLNECTKNSPGQF